MAPVNKAQTQTQPGIRAREDKLNCYPGIFSRLLGYLNIEAALRGLQKFDIGFLQKADVEHGTGFSALP